MIIYFVRHASAGEGKKDAAKDRRRPLDREGIEQCGLMGRTLAALDTQVDRVISSPLKRATQTAALMANEIGYEGQIVTDNALAPSGTVEQFRKMLQKYANMEAVMLVGHNPNFSEFLATTVFPDLKTLGSIELKKGAVARVTLEKRAGTLDWMLSPKVARAVYRTATSSSRPKSLRK